MEGRELEGFDGYYLWIFQSLKLKRFEGITSIFLFFSFFSIQIRAIFLFFSLSFFFPFRSFPFFSLQNYHPNIHYVWIMLRSKIQNREYEKVDTHCHCPLVAFINQTSIYVLKLNNLLANLTFMKMSRVEWPQLVWTHFLFESPNTFWLIFIWVSLVLHRSSNEIQILSQE